MFDSGFGGLTVARALIDLLPAEDVVYVGDTGRYPYGPRPLDEVRDFARQITSFLIQQHDVKMVIVACNTASAAALDLLRFEHDVPLLGCTHYPFLARTIADVMGRDVVLVSSADETAFEVRAILEETGVGHRPRPESERGHHRFLSSGDVGWFKELGGRLLGPELDSVEAVVWP